MTPEQYATLSQVEREPVFCLNLLQDKTPRTLLYGYTLDRETWHVYLDDAGVIHRVVYHPDLMLSHQAGGFKENAELIPSKRLYPEHCDYEACVLLAKAGVSLPFTTLSEHISEKPFHGKTAEEMHDVRTIKFDFYELRKKYDVHPLVVAAAASEAALQLGAAYWKNPYVMYVHWEDAERVHALMEELLPQAQGITDLDKWVRDAHSIFEPYHYNQLTGLGALQEGGHVSAMLEFKLNVTELARGFRIKQAPSGLGYFLYREKTREPFASLLPHSNWDEGRYTFTERLFGRPLPDPADSPLGRYMKKPA